MPIDQRLTRPGIPLHSEFVGGESDTIREIPPEWRAALDLLVEQIPMPWDRPIVPLSDTVLASKAEQQYTSERMMRTTYKPPGVFHLFESYTDRHKALGVRDKSFHFISDWPSVVPQPTALTDVKTRNFGNKHFEMEVETIPTLFTDESFCDERPVVTPADFRALLEEHEHCVDAIGQASPPPIPLPAGTIKYCDNNTNFFEHRTCIRTIDLSSLPREIDNSETNKYKQVEQVHRILELDTTIPALPTSVQDVEFTKLGDGTALEIRKIVPIRFPESKWTRERGIVTPSDFRAKLTEKEVSSVFAGTAADPGIPPAGVLKHEEEQLDVFNMRDIQRTIDVLSLPITINNSQTNKYKQVEAIARTLELDSTVPAVPTALMDVDFTVLGDGTALEIHKSVPSVFAEHKLQRERPIVTPTDFRALLTEKEEDQILIGTASDPFPLTTGQIRHEEQQLTVFTYRDSVRTIDTLTLPATIANSQTNKFKQVEGVTRILEVDTTVPAVPTGLMDVEFTKLGDGTALEIHKTIPSRFNEIKYTRDRPIVTPTDFRAQLTEKETSQVFLGTAADPGVPPAGVMRHEEEQIDVFTMRDILRTIDTLSLPVTINNSQTNRFKQVESIARTLELDTTTPAVPTALMDVEFTKLGDGTALEIHKTVPSLFPQSKWTRERPIVTPPDFRALLTELETSVLSTGIAGDPGAPPVGTLKHEEEQVDVFNMRNIVRTIDTTTLPRTNTNKETNRFKQVVTVDRILELDTTVPALPTALVDVEFTKLGDGTALEIHKTVSEVFNELTATIEIADLVPEIFRAVIPITSEEYVQAGTTINDPPVLGLGDLFREEKRLTELTTLIRHRGRAGITYPQSRVASREIGGEKFGGEIMQTSALLDTTIPAVEFGLGVVTSQVKDLGNGTFFRATQKWDSAVVWPTLHDTKFDREGQIFLAIEKQTVDPSYVSPPPVAYTVEDVQAIDKWHSRRIKTTKDVSAHNTAGTALISYRYHPFKFPCTLDYNRLITYDHREGYRRAAALLCRHTVRTWWINSVTTPTIGPPGMGFQVEVNEIITDTVNVPIFAPNNSTEAQTYPEVLHDNITNTLGAFYPATSPSLTQYYLGTASSTTGSYGVGIAVYPYGTGYYVGQSVSAGGYTFTVSNIGSTGELFGVIPTTVPSGPVIVTSTTNLGNFAVGGGGTLNVIQVNYSVPVAGSGWVNSERVIAATVTQTDIPNLWKIVTEAVVMR